MPSHSHSIKCSDGSGGDPYMVDYNGTSVWQTTLSTLSTGGGAAHNNMPPYKAVYIWERTA